MDLFGQDLSALELYYPDAYEDLQEEIDQSRSGTRSRSRQRQQGTNARRRNARRTKERPGVRRFYVGLLVRRQANVVLDDIQIEDRLSRADMVSKRYLSARFRGDDQTPWMELIDPEPTAVMTAVWDTQLQVITVYQATAQLVEPNEFFDQPHGRLIHRLVLKRTNITSLYYYQQYRYAEALQSLYQ